MRFKHALLLAALAMLPDTAVAQSSQKPIQIFVPFAPGGSADGIARILAAELGMSLNRQVVVDQQAGRRRHDRPHYCGAAARPMATRWRSRRPGRW